MQEILFLEPIFKEMIWGGNRLGTDFGYDIPGENTGECWAISGHKNGDCKIKNGAYAGTTLSTLYKEHKELFGNCGGDEFPLLVKIIDAKQDLSIQVHPDDAYANEHENGSFGKTECWYILDCDPGAKIVVGHNAKDKEELKQMIDEHRFLDLIRVRDIKKGDFFQIEPGTVHAIKAGTLILETQQSSDVTYRLYDYDRLQDGKPRQLHIAQSLDVIGCPHQENTASRSTKALTNGELETMVSCKFYTVEKITLTGEETFVQTEPYTMMSVIEGSGTVQGVAVTKGDHFILPSGMGEYKIDGNLTIMKSYIG